MAATPSVMTSCPWCCWNTQDTEGFLASVSPYTHLRLALGWMLMLTYSKGWRLPESVHTSGSHKWILQPTARRELD